MKKSVCYILFLFLMFSCNKVPFNPNGDEMDDWLKKYGKDQVKVSPETVLLWNQAAIDVVGQTQNLVPNPPIPPFIESRYYAMVNLAMHDALNNIIPFSEPYALKNAANKQADPDAAVAQAAHDVIMDFYGKLNPPAFITPQPVKDYITSLLQTTLDKVNNPEAKEKGIALGKAAAKAILDNRINDGIGEAMFPIAEGTTPGAYRFTFPFNGPPFNNPPFSGLYDFPGWGNVKPFGLNKSKQFRPSPPDDVSKSAYAADFNEVKSLGRYNSVTRTAEQTEIAKFWAESSPQGWNRIAVTVLKKKNANAWQAARLLALLQMSEADAYIGCLEAKYHYFYWRPVTAIRLADTDNNPETTRDADWEVLGWNPAGPPEIPFWPTPPIADYPSAHATAGGAGAEILKMFFGKDEIEFSTKSATFPSTRNFSSFSKAARENSLSRIYIGYHFRKACNEGEDQGKKIGKWNYEHQLRMK